MTTATKFRDRPHARIYAHWRQYPAWTSLGLVARALLVEMLMEYRPGTNGRLAWSCRKAARAVGVSKDRAARALIELEMRGWVTVERVANFGRRNLPAEYALTMYANDASGAPASYAFEAWDPKGSPLQSLSRVVLGGHDGRISGTRPSRLRDTAAMRTGPIQVSDALKMSRAFKGFSPETRLATKPTPEG
jgi:hypothetical protein